MMRFPEISDKTSFLFDRVLAKFVDFLAAFAFGKIGALLNSPFVGEMTGFAYLLVSDGFPGGRSLGKRLTGLLVLRKDDCPCRFFESTVRNLPIGLAYLMSLIPYVGPFIFSGMVGIEFLLMVGQRSGRRLGDDLAQTRVAVKEERPPVAV
ncbi:MAG: RDD family protein [Leptospirales bacterium]